MPVRIDSQFPIVPSSRSVYHSRDQPVGMGRILMEHNIDWAKLAEVILAALPDDNRVVVLLPIIFLVACGAWMRWGDPVFTSDTRADFGSWIVRGALRYLCLVILVLFGVYVGAAVVVAIAYIVAPAIRETFADPGPNPVMDEIPKVLPHPVQE